MSQVVAIILALTGALMPVGTTEFTVDMAKEKIAFVKQKNGDWLTDTYKNGKKSGKSIGVYRVEGLKVSLIKNGNIAQTRDISALIGITDPKKLNALSEMKFLDGSKLDIKKAKDGFSISGTIGDAGEAKVSWKK